MNIPVILQFIEFILHLWTLFCFGEAYISPCAQASEGSGPSDGSLSFVQVVMVFGWCSDDLELVEKSTIYISLYGVGPGMIGNDNFSCGSNHFCLQLKAIDGCMSLFLDWAIYQRFSPKQEGKKNF